MFTPQRYYGQRRLFKMRLYLSFSLPFPLSFPFLSRTKGTDRDREGNFIQLEKRNFKYFPNPQGGGCVLKGVRHGEG